MGKGAPGGLGAAFHQKLLDRFDAARALVGQGNSEVGTRIE